MNIIKCTSTVNTTYKKNRTIKYIVLHYTAGVKSTKGSAKNISSFFAKGTSNGSADFIVDDCTMVQYNPDIKNRYCWAVGGTKYKSMCTSEGGKYYNVCTNANSISIEMCSNKTNTKSLLATDTDWHLTDATVNNAVELTKYLMKQYNIPIENVIMHHHVTGKVCPNPWCVNESRLSKWNEFKNMLIGTTKEVDDEVITEGKAIINGKEYKVDRILKDNANFIKASNFSNMGFDVGFNADTKAVVINNKVDDIIVNDKKVKAIKVDGFNYVKLRDLAEILGKNVNIINGNIIIE